MKRASRSSSYSSPHIILSSDARPILLLASSSPPSVAKTAETDRRRCDRIAAISSGLGIGTPAHQEDPGRGPPALPPAGPPATPLTPPAGGPLDDPLHHALAGAAALAGPGPVHHATDRPAAVLDGLPERSLA